MKKKIKDLTLEEVKKICKNEKCNSKCQFFTFNGFYFCKLKNYIDDTFNKEEYGEGEIEVDLSEEED